MTRAAKPDIRLVGVQPELPLANLAYNFDRLVFHERRTVTG